MTFSPLDGTVPHDATTAEIILARHGPPTKNAKQIVLGTHLGAWATSYNEAGLAPNAEPSPALREAVRSHCVVASDLRRSVESAMALDSIQGIVVEPLLREVPVPPSVGVPLPLPALAWLIVARVGWYIGWLDAGEPIQAVRMRARRAAARLEALATPHRPVLVVGHAFFNHFLSRELRARGWQGRGAIRSRYWSGRRLLRATDAEAPAPPS